jgi:hypothetical protein
MSRHLALLALSTAVLTLPPLLTGCGKSGGGPAAPPGAISVYLQTSPSGAAVFADGSAIGVYTPAAASVSPGGSLRLSLLGYVDSTFAAPAQSETLRVTLRPSAGTPAHFTAIRLTPPPTCPRAGGIAVGQDGKIYVPSLCGSSGTLSIYSATGALLTSWSLSGPIGGYSGLAVDSQGSVYVATWSGNDSFVEKYSSAGALLYALSSPSSGGTFNRFLSAVTIGTGDSLYVCSLGQVLIYGRDNSASTRSVPIATSSTAFGTITRDASGNWYACRQDTVQTTSDAVFKVAPEGGSAVSSWQILLNGYGDVLGVRGDARLYVYAFRTTGVRVQRYSLDEQLLAEWTIKAPDSPGTVSDFGVALAPNGDVFELTGWALLHWSN